MSRNAPVVVGELRLRDAAIFGVGQRGHARRFARRAMALPEVRSITIEPRQGVAHIRYRTAPAERKAFLERLADAVGSDLHPLDDADIPHWPEGETVTLSRAGDLITVLRIVESHPGRLRVTHRSFADRQGSVACRMERVLRTFPGVLEVSATSTSSALNVRFDPSLIDAASIVKAIEIQLASNGSLQRVAEPESVPLGLANTTVGLGTVGELMLPLATPVAAGILVATNLGVARDAAVQLTRGKIGLPIFHTALLACSIATGQVLAFALTDWSLRYWQRHWRKNLAKETLKLLDDTLALPELVRLLGPEGLEKHVPLDRIRAGERIRVATAERIPADGRVLAGEALVDETLVRGARGPLRKTVDDEVLAGSAVLVGTLDVAVERVGQETEAARIAETIVDLTASFPSDHRMQRQSEQLADRTVLPTLATAGIGWVAGDLITVGAILHQDWISGPALAVPLLTLNHIREALRSGALVRSSTAIQRLAESDFVVLDGDDPLLSAPVLELAEVQSRVPDTDTVLRHVAGAGLYLGDERTLALANACRQRGLIVRQPILRELGPGRVEVQFSEHTIRLTDEPSAVAEQAPVLLVEIDGNEVARLIFRPGVRPRAADAVMRLRAAGLQTFLVSSGPDSGTNELARLLGVDLSGGELDAEGRIRFLQGLRRRGVHPTYVGSLREHPELAPEAHVSVAVGGLNGTSPMGDVMLLGDCYDSLADLVELSREYQPDLVSASRMATIPNLLCVAGAFGGLLNGITAGIIANIGVMNVDRRLRRALLASAYSSRSGKLLALR